MDVTSPKLDSITALDFVDIRIKESSLHVVKNVTHCGGLGGGDLTLADRACQRVPAHSP